MSNSERKERLRQADIQRLKGLRPIDDDFMRCMFRDNIALTQYVLRIFTQKSDLNIISVKTQADMKRLAGARSICLDAYGVDDSGKRYDIEVQRADKGAGAHRARYHSSVLDIENLSAGQDFDELPETYTIFLTENDVFSRGCPLYPVERMNMATGQPFGDGEHILYVNGAYRGDDELGRLMHDFSCAEPDSMLCDEMAATTRYLKENGNGGIAMCKIVEEIVNEHKAEAQFMTMLESIRNVMDALNMTPERAMDILKVPQEEREKYYAALQA